MNAEYTSYVLRVTCPDTLGLIHGITGVLSNAGLNIVENNEYVDPANRTFFLRCVCEGQADTTPVAGAIASILPEPAEVELKPQRKKQVVILVTREAHCLGDLLVRHAYGELGAEIRAVIGNYDTLAPLTTKFDLPFVTVPHDGETRASHEAALAAAIDRFPADYLVLAKYIRILSPEFVRRYRGKLINIHHSFLPAFIGANPYRQAYERGVKIIGATAHFVTADLDEGPIIDQDVVRVDHADSLEQMKQAGRDVEKVVLARALQWVCADRVFVNGNKTVVF